MREQHVRARPAIAAVDELRHAVAEGGGENVKYAEAIMPLRKTGNKLMCTLLLGNVASNSYCSILLDELCGDAMGGQLGLLLSVTVRYE